MRNIRTAYYAMILLMVIALLSISGVYSYLVPQLDNTSSGRSTTLGDLDTRGKANQSLSREAEIADAANPPIKRVEQDAGARPSRDEGENHTHDSPFASRSVSYLNTALGYRGTPQQCVEKHFSYADLSDLYRMLEGRYDPNGYAFLLDAICILERDKEKAQSAVVEFIKRRVDWSSFIENEMNYEDWKERYRAVSALGYLNHAPSNDFLVTLLNVDEARKVVLESAGPEEYWVIRVDSELERAALESSGRNVDHAWVEHSTLMLGGGAAFGLLITGDDSQFRHVEDAYRAIRTGGVHGLSILDKAWGFQLRDTIGRYRLFKDKGWEEGIRLLGELHWEDQILMYQRYYPDW